jgi:hypothetical protein
LPTNRRLFESGPAAPLFDDDEDEEAAIAPFVYRT